MFGLYAVLSGMAPFLVEEIRINKTVLLGLTQPQLWSLLVVVVGFVLLLRTRGPAVDTVPLPKDVGDGISDRASTPDRGGRP